MRTEAGIADTAECVPLDPALAGVAAALQADPYYRAAFDTLPTAVEMVELDKLIVSQSHIANLFSEERGWALGSSPSAEALFHFCLPLERENPPVRVQRLSSDRYLFSSRSSDLRSQDPVLLRASQCAGIGSPGPLPVWSASS